MDEERFESWVGEVVGRVMGGPLTSRSSVCACWELGMGEHLLCRSLDVTTLMDCQYQM